MSYKGQIAGIPLGPAGLTGSVNLALISPEQLIEANNLTYESGSLQKEGGASKYNSTAITGTPDVLGGHDWDHNGSTQRMIVLTSAGDLLKDSGDGSFSTTLKGSLSVSSVDPVFVEGGAEAAARDRKLFVFTGSNVVQVLAADGATTADITTPPADWSGGNQPKFGLIHENRLWGFGNANDPHRVYYSDDDNHEDFSTDAGSLSVYPGESETLIAAVSFKGVLILFKYPTGIYLIDTTSVTQTNWRVDRLTNKVGTVSAHSALIVDNDVMYMDTSGNIHLISATQQFGNFNNSSVSEVATMAPFIRSNVNLGQLSLVRMVYYEAQREVHALMPGTGSSVNTRRLVVDLNRPGLARFRFSDRDTLVSAWTRKDSDGIPRLVGGDDAGFVWLLDQTNRSFDGVGYEGKFRTPNDDFSRLDPRLGSSRKNGQFLEIDVEPKGNWNLAVDIIWDGEITDTVQFNMGQSGAALGSFVLDTDKLADEQVLTRRRRITGGGRRFSIAGSNNGDGQDFSIAQARLHFTPGAEDLI